MNYFSILFVLFFALFYSEVRATGTQFEIEEYVQFEPDEYLQQEVAEEKKADKNSKKNRKPAIIGPAIIVKTDDESKPPFEVATENSVHPKRGYAIEIEKSEIEE